MPNTPILPPAPTTPNKQDVLARMLAEFPLVRVMFDPIHPAIEGLPTALRVTAAQALDVGYDLARSIPDLALDHIGMSGTMSYRGVPVWTLIPWAAIFALQPNAAPAGSVLWPESVPEVLFRKALRASYTTPTDGGGGGARVYNLDSRRSPQDRHACELRRAGHRAPPAPAPTSPGGGGCAA